MTLPASWVSRIFAKLTVAYGRDFLARWEGIDLELVKADWAEELAGYVQNPTALAHALENLPAEKPPNAKQFRALCNGRPEPRMQALPAPVDKPSPEVMAKVAGIAASTVGPKQWAQDLRERERESHGIGMTRAQREMWRTALGEPMGCPA